MTIALNEIETPAGESALVSVEAAIGAPLPPQLRAFLSAHNGAVPEPNFYGPDELVSLRYIYSAGPTDFTHLPEIAAQAELVRGGDWQVDPDFVPIAEDDGGNFTLIGVRGEHAGRIYHLDHDLDEEPRLVASGFDELIAGLEPM